MRGISWGKRMNQRITIPDKRIQEFCVRWKIKELALFGSILGENFKPESDIDILVTFKSDARWTMFDWVQMRDELKEIFERDVDLVSRRGLETSRNSLRREAILTSAEVVYAA